MSKGWFEGLIVWPIAQIINLISSKTDAGVGIILTTLLIQMLVFVFTRKSQMSTQRMQEIQPEIQKIQNKYKDKTDERSADGSRNAEYLSKIRYSPIWFNVNYFHSATNHDGYVLCNNAFSKCC
jgi:membrane protein insertase Oxa1/YidC/SpoIIIJ